MKTLSLKLQEPIFEELEFMISQFQKNRNAYINDAVAFYNKAQRRVLLAQQLDEECKVIRDLDYEVFQEMEALEDPID